MFQDIDRLQHYGQQYGADASYDTLDPNQINPAVFFSDDAEANTGELSWHVLVSFHRSFHLLWNALAYL